MRGLVRHCVIASQRLPCADSTAHCVSVERGGLVAVPGGLVLVKADCRLEPLQQAFHLRPGH